MVAHREIPLTRGAVALVDEADYGRVAAFKWSLLPVRGKLYAKRQIWKGPCVLLHRFILDAQPGLMVDHRNGNGLDNRRENLRLATRSQNQWNAGARKGRRFKGARRSNSKAARWVACIGYEGRFIHLGTFGSEEEAARAYDAAAAELHGEFAKLNFPLSAIM